MFSEIVDLSNVSEGNIYYMFDNDKMKDLTKLIYLDSDSILGYNSSDSIIVNMVNRTNIRIKYTFDPIFNGKLRYIKDTVGFNGQYLVYSEPFFINDNLICISSTTIKPEENFENQWVWFLKRKKESFDLIWFYNRNKDCYYEKAELPKIDL